MMINDIKADLARYCQIESGSAELSFFRQIRVWLQGYGLQALAVHRFYRWSLQGDDVLIKVCKAPLLAVAFLCHIIIGKLYDIHVSPHAQIGQGCYIGHFGGIHIGRCHIGELCNINHQVTIEDSDDIVHQVVIGDRVWIGAHSTVKRHVRIADGVTVSAGTIVKSDVEENALVAGLSTRVLKRNYDNTVLLALTR